MGLIDDWERMIVELIYGNYFLCIASFPIRFDSFTQLADHEREAMIQGMIFIQKPFRHRVLVYPLG